MKQLKLILIFITVATSNLFAQTFELNYIYYEVTSSTSPYTVEVTVGGYYSGNITIPAQVSYNSQTYSVTSIGAGAFDSCAMSSISIPNSVTSIGDYAFSECYNLTSVVIPNSVTSIGDNAFYKCSSLTSVVIPNSVTSIEHGAFSWCTDLISVEIPNSVTNIGDYAFSGCTSLTSITIPNSVKSIGVDVFSYCSSLTSIVIPNSVISIGYSAFYNCSSLISINVAHDNINYSSLNGVFYNKNATTLIKYPCGVQGLFEIPNSVTSIEDGAFGNCGGLTSVIIPNTVTNIGSYVFYGCSNLESITCLTLTPPILEMNVFGNVPKNIPLYVPYQSVYLYKQADQWKDFNVVGIIPNIGSGEYLVSGKVYLDENSNKQKDVNEFGMLNQELLILPDSIYTGTDDNGNYYFRTSSGNYEVKLLIKDNWQLTTDSVSYKVIVNNSDTSGFDFGIKGINDISKLETYITSLDAGRCFQSTPFYLTYKNTGTKIENGLLSFYPDEKLKEIISSVPMYDSLSSDTSAIYWNFSNLRPYEQNKIKLNLTMPDFTSMGDTLISVITIDNGISVQGSDTSKIAVRCSYDPNDKLVYPEGVYDEKFVLMNETLNYTIRFQNTGNDTAYQVIVIDTLDSSLDLNTFEVLSSSHDLQTSYTKDGIVEFRFDNIMLVDSTTNQPESQGFVKYKIKAKSGLEDNTVVKNTGYIFFDYNPPVITNTTINTMTYNISKLEVEEQSKQTDKVNFYPNPFSQTAKIEFDNKNNETYQLQITDITGKQIQTQKSNRNAMIIEKGKMQSGMYFYKLQNTKSGESFNGKFVIE